MWAEVERALSQAGGRTIENLAGLLPGALVLIVMGGISLILAAGVRVILLRALRSFEFDRRADGLGLAVLADWSRTRSASAVLASAAFWTILLIGVLVGLTAFDAPLPARLAISVFEYLPHVIAAVLIVIVGGLLARFLSRTVLIGAVNMHLASARLLSLVVKWLVVMIAGAMALEHLDIGRTVLFLAFGILFGGVVLALSIAVGLGARDAVRRALEQQAHDMAQPTDKLDHV